MINELINCQHCNKPLKNGYKLECHTDYQCTDCDYSFCFASDILELHYALYNGSILEDIYNQAIKLTFANNNYLELINYVLANAKINGEDVFTYGSSPRSLFPDNKDRYELFLKVFKIWLNEDWNKA